MKNDNDCLRSEIALLIAEASTCWDPQPSTEVFDSAKAEDIVDRIMALFPTREEPWLGRASTAQLLDELKARAEIGGYANYRTVDSD